MNARCLKCHEVHAELELSTSGPIKEMDSDGRLVRRWIHVCPCCFSDQLQPTPRRATP